MRRTIRDRRIPPCRGPASGAAGTGPGHRSAEDLSFPVIPRRDAVPAGKETAEDELVGKPRELGDPGAGFAGIPEHVFRFGEAQIQQISPRRDPEDPAEFFLEGRAGAMTALRQFVQRDLFVPVPPDEPHGVFQFPEPVDREDQRLLRRGNGQNLLQEQERRGLIFQLVWNSPMMWKKS